MMVKLSTGGININAVMRWVEEPEGKIKIMFYGPWEITYSKEDAALIRAALKLMEFDPPAESSL
jgi:hypothetical protein